MSLPTWTVEELQSNIVHLKGECWRLVESQSESSTMKLVDNDEEHDILEKAIEDTKPNFPAGCQHLHYLLKTPFRYAPYPNGSRFRRANQREGAFYGSENVETAIAEMAFYRVLFFSESPDTPLPENPGAYTAFTVKYNAPHSIDLTEQPLNKDEKHWTHPNDYEACQKLADTARQARIEAIRNQSVRCPAGGKNVTLISHETFTGTEPGNDRQAWRFAVKRMGVMAVCEFPEKRLFFPAANFAALDDRVKVFIRT
ncbi:MAG: RES family NAD+ phosphorylase [Rhodospirillales bacterium]|nr:RES family NAD+ phosphorylase [Rhodospirillales bacterium]MCB9996245.1 RES family NAD+ phosphorylase [Rhodospirillales bacterium]